MPVFTHNVVPDIPLKIYIVLVYKDDVKKYRNLHCIAAVSPNTS